MTQRNQGRKTPVFDGVCEISEGRVTTSPSCVCLQLPPLQFAGFLHHRHSRRPVLLLLLLLRTDGRTLILPHALPRTSHSRRRGASAQTDPVVRYARRRGAGKQWLDLGQLARTKRNDVLTNGIGGGGYTGLLLLPLLPPSLLVCRHPGPGGKVRRIGRVANTPKSREQLRRLSRIQEDQFIDRTL